MDYSALLQRSGAGLLAFLTACTFSSQQTEQPTETEVGRTISFDTIPNGMVWIPGGSFMMGTEDPEFPDASPIHPVSVDGFWMDEHEVTNAQFAEFVEATGY